MLLRPPLLHLERGGKPEVAQFVRDSALSPPKMDSEAGQRLAFEQEDTQFF